MVGIQLSNRFVQDQNLRPEGNRSRQSQKMGLAPGQLEHIIIFSPSKTAEIQGLQTSLFIVLHAVVHACVRGVIQNCRTDDLILKILIYIACFLSQRSDICLQRGDSSHQHFPLEITGNKMGDQPIHNFTKSGLSASIISHNSQKVPFFNL